jgi:hypothetical protein
MLSSTTVAHFLLAIGPRFLFPELYVPNSEMIVAEPGAREHNADSPLALVGRWPPEQGGAPSCSRTHYVSSYDVCRSRSPTDSWSVFIATISPRSDPSVSAATSPAEIARG